MAQPTMAYPPGVAPAARPVTAPYTAPRAQPGGGRESSGARIWGGIGLAAMAMAIIGSVLPWAKVFFMNMSGWEGDGKITFFAGVLVLILFIVGLIAGNKWPFIVCIIGSIIIAAVAIYHIADLMSVSSSVVGYGLYVTVAGGLLGLVAAIGGIAAKRW